MRYAAKKDINHKHIAAIFKAAGWDVIDTSKCHGVLLDFIAQKRYTGVAWFVEAKSENGELTEFEKKFIKAHPEKSVVIRSAKEAIEFVNNLSNY